MLNMIPIDRARSLLDYDPATGILRWREDRTAGTKAGDMAGTPNGDGYLKVSIIGKRYFSHRVVFAMYYGRQPTAQIDHIDGDRYNNKISNLREATHSQNVMNTRRLDSNSVGVKNISIKRRKYLARIQANKRIFYVGSFETLNEASEAIQRARKHFHGEFARHG
jgi:hypothetical protein